MVKKLENWDDVVYEWSLSSKFYFNLLAMALFTLKKIAPYFEKITKSAAAPKMVPFWRHSNFR